MVGQGWDLFLNRKASGFCIDGKVLTDTAAAATTIDFTRIDDHEQLFDSLNIDASASYSGFGASASANFSFAKSLSVDSDALNVLAKVKLDREVIMMVPDAEDGNSVRSGKLILNNDAKALLQLDTTDAAKSGKSLDEQQKEAYERFRLRCGDAFVIGLRKGGELDGFLTFKMTDRNAKQALATSVGGGGFGAQVNVAVTAIYNEQTKASSFEYKWFQSGYTPGATNPKTVDEFIEKFSKFGTELTFSAIPYEIYLLSYSQIESAIKTDKYLPANSYLNTLANHYWRLSDLFKQYDDVVLSPDNFYVSTFAPNGWQDIYDTQSWIWNASHLLDTALYVCYRQGKCDEAENSSAVLEQLSVTPTDADTLIAIIAGSAATYRGSPKNALLQSLQSLISHKAADALGAEYSKPTCGDYCIYYVWLASKPISKVELSSLWSLDYNDDKSLKGGVKSAGAPAGSPSPDELVKYADAELRGWILRNRLLPISDSFCKKATKHPLCMTAEQLVNIVSTVRLNLDPQYLTPPAGTPPPPRQLPAPEPPVGPPPYHDPCHGHPCK